MRSAARLLPVVALAAPLAAAQPSEPQGSLGGLVRADDYPPEAIRRGEQGTTQVRLTIGTDGRVSRCEVVMSSGSPSIDAKTCAVMTERARLTPARDASGKPVEGTFTQRITWRMQVNPLTDSAFAAQLGAWAACVRDQAGPRLASGQTAERIAEAAFSACAASELSLEEAAKAAPGTGGDTAAALASLRTAMVDELRKAIAEFARAPKPAAGAGLISADDYPDEALRLGHQGSARVRMTVGTDGLVKDCTLVDSSGSPWLDARSCEVMLQRARYTPGTDEAGRPVSGTVEQRITWRIAPDDDPAMRQRLVREQWRGCVHAQAAKFAGETGAAESLADRAVNACRPEERAFRLALGEGFTVVDVPATVRGFRRQYRGSALGVINAARKQQ